VIEAMRALMSTGWDWTLIGQAFIAIALLGAQIIDREEARSLLGIPSSTAATGDLTPGRV